MKKKLDGKLGALARHGDIGLLVTQALPSNSVRKDHKVVAEGEATGHAHRLEGEAFLYEKDGELWIHTGKEPATITHEEHGPIELPTNAVLRVIRQREWTPVGDRAVLD